MNVAEGRFPDAKHQLAALFQYDVGRPVNQIVPLAVSDGGKRSHTARRDNHAVRDKGTARYGGALIRIGIRARGEYLAAIHGEGGFMDECPRSPLAQHKMALDAGILQYLQQSNAEYRARRSGYTYYQSHSFSLST